MKQKNDFIYDMLDYDQIGTDQQRIWCADTPVEVTACQGQVEIIIPFYAQKQQLAFERDPNIEPCIYTLIVQAYRKNMIRCSIAFDDRKPDDPSEMLSFDPSLKQVPLEVKEIPGGWNVIDDKNKKRMTINTRQAPVDHWSDIIKGPDDTFDVTVYPDGKRAVPFMAYDQFFPEKRESLPLAFIEQNGEVSASLFSLYAQAKECFAGTGERFDKLDLAGRTIALENMDGLGVNSRRAYKNVPFYLSSRMYGLFIHTSCHGRLSLADISTRAVQGSIEDAALDMFFIADDDIERILYHYRCLTGFPPEPPAWSYGIWMSRMTYFSADEVEKIADRLRQEDYPCDVLHLDSGWFEKDGRCDWEFSKERFSEPEKFIQKMRSMGFRISLWQNPNISQDNKHYKDGVEKGYIVKVTPDPDPPDSDFFAKTTAGHIDFTNPDAVEWYQGLLADLLRKGASAIKTDFGERIDMDAKFKSMPTEKVHNIYSLLYQKAAYEITQKITGEGLIWARAGWAGCQRYPIHWAGDSASSWDGLAGSLRGGLHLGLSGFAFWSHDIPGFHGVPDFMNSKPSDELYVRWTQFGVFSSHMRYHGAHPREPWEYPNVSDIVRKWWKLRYTLIPYLIVQAYNACRSGYPMLRAMIMHHPEDVTC
ncbi:MAG: alpha-xylosidase, partial [Anaerohalosphaera sp.]|nr:alpha-xylosidase [Anaerohalosphaera sp.]